MGIQRTIRQSVKRTMYAVAPRMATAIFSARSRAKSHRMVAEWGLRELNRRLVDALGPRVRSGPFEGMMLTPMSMKEHLGPFLLGTYEAELHPWLRELLQRTFSQIIDVGSKFGYYAVGLARAQPGTEVIAFDTDWWARRATIEVATANEVATSVTVKGYCTPAWLRSSLKEGALIISDCEGYEAVLFDGAIPQLASATAIIEIHEDAAPGVGRLLRARFSETHDIRAVASAAPPPTPPSVDLGFLQSDEARQASTEIRPPQEWLLVTPRPS